jgi:hypothetical protein
MEYKIVFIALAICFLSVIESVVAAPLPSPATASVVEENMETWAVNYPRAASELEVWVTTYRDTARALFKWDGFRPEQSKTFVIWVNTHQGKGIDVFSAQHTDWLRFNEIIVKYRSEMSAFVVWCRFHPKASTALMQHPRALHWVGRHLYKSSLKAKDD